MFNVKFKGHEDGIYNVSSVATVEQANKIKLDLLGLGYTVWVEEAKPAPAHQEMYGAISQCLEQEMDCLMHKGAKLEDLRNVAIEVVHDLVNDWLAQEMSKERGE